MYAKAALAVLLLLFPVSYALQISEIMYNPSGSDTDHEWVEIYNNDSETYNMTGWKLRTDTTDHSLNQNGSNLIIQPGVFAVIAQDAGTFLSDYANSSNITVIDSSWSDLTNTVNKSIVIKNSSVVFDNVTYSIVAEGNTSCKVNSSFVECMPSPGAVNMVFLNATNATSNLTSINYTDVRLSINVSSLLVNSTYPLFLLEIDNKTCSALDNVTISYNITPNLVNGTVTREVACSALAVNWTPAAGGNYTICGQAIAAVNETNLTNNAVCKAVSVSAASCNMSISISSAAVFNDTQTAEYKLIVNDTVCGQENSFDIEYWIEDLFGAYAKEKINTSQSMVCGKAVDRQWTPNKINGSEAYRIVANLSAACDAHAADNFVEKFIAVRGSLSQATSAVPPSSGTSSHASGNVSQPKKFEAEIISFPASVFVDDPFEVVVRLSSPGRRNVSIYSYVFSGNTPVSLGRQTDAKQKDAEGVVQSGVVQQGWKGTWDANKQSVEIEANATETVVLLSKIENGTSPGSYSLRAKIKEDGKDLQEVTKAISVVERPRLRVETYNKTLSVSSPCSSCDIMVVGSGMERVFTGGGRLENISGVFHIFLLKNSKILSKQSVNISAHETEPGISANAGKTLPVTGLSVRKSADLEKYIFLIKLLSQIKLF